MQVYGVIPSRYQSTRLEAKALADIDGKPMFWHVYTQAAKAHINKVFLATDDIRIEESAQKYGIKAIMTKPEHNSGTDRIHEAICQIAKDTAISDEDIIINIQGDEPLLEPQMLNELIAPFAKNPHIDVCTLAHKLSTLKDEERFYSPNTVKIVLDNKNNALYFSRAPIPYLRDKENNKDTKEVFFYAHIGLYAFKFSALKQFVSLQESFLEQTEKLEQLRLLENGLSIYVAQTKFPSQGVDTLEDLEKVRKIMQERKSKSISSSTA